MESDKKVRLFVDESYDTDFCAVCIVCVQGEKNYQLLLDQLRKIDLDPSVGVHNAANNFHYNEDSIGMRQSLAPWISKMPISAYLAVTQMNIPELKQDKDRLVYYSLFPEILKPLEMKFSRRLGEDVDLSIRFENLSDKITHDLHFFKDILNKIPRCRDIYVSVVTKNEEPLLFLPDYFLGFIRDYFTRGEKETWPVDSLKLLSGKIGLFYLLRDTEIVRYERGEEIFNFLR